MIQESGSKVRLLAFFKSSGQGAPGLAVTVDVFEIEIDGTSTQRWSDVVASEVGGGLYFYDHTMVETAYLVAVFKTVDQCDSPNIPAIGISRVLIDATDFSTYYSSGDSIVMGRGTGSVRFDDTLSDGINPSRGITIRAFAYTGASTIDWSRAIAKDVTAGDGSYYMFLDPGKYEFSLERNGVQLTTITKTVV